MKMSSQEEKPQSNESPLHILIIPFPAPGHTIPLVDLTRRLLPRYSHLSITFVTTPSSLSFLQPLLSTFPPPRLQPLVLTPPSRPPNAKASPTSTIRAFHVLSDPIISWFQSHPNPPRVIVYDFCSWAHQLTSTLGVPRIVFYPSGAFGSAVFNSMWRAAPSGPQDHDLEYEVEFDDVVGSPRFKWSELSFLFRSGRPGDPDWDVFRADMMSNHSSWGAVFNTFSELEGVHVEHFMKEMGHDRVWAVGPLLDDDPADVAQNSGSQTEQVMTWLDSKADCSVVYICFGSRCTLTDEESKALRSALESSKVHFIWCVRESDGQHGINTSMIGCESDDRMMGENGLVINGWAPQRDILKHRAVGGFVTHCGWNSTIESIQAGVVMLAWPMGADQYTNAKLVVDQLGLGMRVNRDGPNGVPDPYELSQLLIKSVSAAQPERDRMRRMAEAAAMAVDGGSSAVDLDRFIEQLSEFSL